MLMANWMKINADKFGIKKILKRKRKLSKIENVINIPEVENYQYLGITINKSLKLKDHVIQNLRYRKTFMP